MVLAGKCGQVVVISKQGREEEPKDDMVLEWVGGSWLPHILFFLQPFFHWLSSSYNNLGIIFLPWFAGL